MSSENNYTKCTVNSFRGSETGSTTTLFAVSLVAVFGVMALAVDYAAWMNRTSDLQAQPMQQHSQELHGLRLQKEARVLRNSRKRICRQRKLRPALPM